jgi:hypothetical protein
VGLLLPRKNAAASTRAYGELSLGGIGYQQLLSDRDEGNAQESGLDLEARLISRSLAISSRGSAHSRCRMCVVEFTCSRQPTKLVKTAARQSSPTSAKRSDIVIITDSDPESDHHDDN